MSDGLYISVSGALARLRDLEVVANNLANVETTGFKRDRPTFEAALQSSLQGQEGELVAGAAGRSFVRVGGAAIDFASGPARTTGSPLDVALQGRGFFEVETDQGPRYTRAGAFQISAEGNLVTLHGDPVHGDGGPLQAGDRFAEILPTGEVVDDEGAVLGRLKVVDFADPERLLKDGNNLYRSADGQQPETLESFELLPRSLEGSNVQPVRELAALVTLQRAFDAAMRSLTADDQITRQLIQEMHG